MNSSVILDGTVPVTNDEAKDACHNKVSQDILPVLCSKQTQPDLSNEIHH